MRMLINALSNKQDEYRSVGSWMTPFIINICCNNINTFFNYDLPHNKLFYNYKSNIIVIINVIVINCVF